MRSWLRVVAALGTRPTLWATAVRQIGRLAPARWWRRPPFAPLPARDYLAFRLVTQYGTATHDPVPEDVVAYLEWCRRYERIGRRP